MKKKIILIVVLIILLILLIPIPIKLRDGGSIEYRALLYTVTRYNKLDESNETKFVNGTKIEILGFEVYDNTVENLKNQNNSDMKNTLEDLSVALTLEDEIQADTIWCGTFQLIWNDLKNDLAKQDIVFTPQLDVVNNLNKETFTTDDLSEESYYKKIGTPSLELKEEIENAIKEKFNETSNILDDFDWEKARPEDYFLYVMLKKEFEFETEFEELENGNFGDYENVKYFGIENDESELIRNQVQVLYYNSKDDFAIKLLTKENDEVILSKKPQGKTFNEIYKNILNKQNEYVGEKNLQKGEQLKVPNISINSKKEFTEIENKLFTFSNNDEYKISKALQTIKFDLDRKGGKIISEAGMMVQKQSVEYEPEEKREFFLDDTFALFLIESGKDTPYFAALIDDITKFQ